MLSNHTEIASWNWKQQNMKLFIADDSEIIRTHLKELFAEMDQVELIGEACDSIQAIELLKDKSPDVVILDLRMPGGNGIKVLKELQKRKIRPITIIYTAFAYPQHIKLYTNAGADYFIDKNQGAEPLIEIISSLTNQSALN